MNKQPKIKDGFVVAFDALLPRCKRKTMSLSETGIPTLPKALAEAKRLHATGRALNIHMALFRKGRVVKGTVATLEELV